MSGSCEKIGISSPATFTADGPSAALPPMNSRPKIEEKVPEAQFDRLLSILDTDITRHDKRVEHNAASKAPRIGASAAVCPVFRHSAIHRAAESGVSEAQYNLGGLYYNGVGVDKDLRLAASWFRLAAECNHAGAVTEKAHDAMVSAPRFPASLARTARQTLQRAHVGRTRARVRAHVVVAVVLRGPAAL